MALYAIIWKKLSNHGHVSKTQCGTKIMYKILTKLTNTPEKKRLLGNFTSLAGLQIFTYALPLITLPYLVRSLGIEKYGLVMFAQAFINFFHIIVDYGFNLSATREVAVYRDNQKKITEIFSSVLIIKIILLFISFTILFIIITTIPKFSTNKFLYILTFTIVVGQALFPIWYFQGMEKMKYITFVNIISRIVFTIAIFIFIRNEENYMLVPVLNGLGVCVGSFYALYIIKKEFKQQFTIPPLKTLIHYFKDSTQFFLSRASVSMYTTANTFVLGFFTSNTMVGYYSIADKLYRAIQSLFSPLNQALYPFVAKERNIKLYKKILSFAIIINIIGITFAFFAGEWIFSVFFTQKIGPESIKIFKIFLCANLLAVPSVLIGYPLLGAMGYTSFTNISVIISSIYHLLGLVVLMLLKSISIYSIAILFVSTVVVEFGIRAWGVKKYKLLRESDI